MHGIIAVVFGVIAASIFSGSALQICLYQNRFDVIPPQTVSCGNKL